MKTKKSLLLLAVVAVLLTAAGIGLRSLAEKKPERTWTEVAPGVLRSPGWPAGYALLRDSETALLIDCPRPLEEIKAQGIKQVTTVLLTHHHRDSCAFLGDYLKANIPVYA